MILKNTIDKCYEEGKKIFSIVATLGTTIRGAIDPIEEISRICKEKIFGYILMVLLEAFLQLLKFQLMELVMLILLIQ